MGDLIVTMHTSADGYVARSNGSLWDGFGWPAPVQARLTEIYKTASTVVYGPRLFQAVVPFWTAVHEDPDSADARDVGPEGREFAAVLATLPKIVFGAAPTQAHADLIRFTDEPVPTVLEQLKSAQRAPVLLLAGPKLLATAFDAGLVDELLLIVGTVVLGSGMPLLGELQEPIQLRLQDAQPFPPSTSLISYRTRPTDPT